MEKVIKVLSVFLSLFIMIGCVSALKKYTLPLKDLKDISLYSVILECNSFNETHVKELSKIIKVCDAGVEKGKMFCENIRDFECSKDKVLLLSGFDGHGIASVRSYLEYSYDELDNCRN